MAEAAAGKTPKSLRRRMVRALGLGTVVSLLLFVPPFVPTRIDALSREHPPIEDRSGRKPAEPRAPETVTDVREEEVSFAGLKGTLQIPAGIEGKRPAVIILHASGPMERDGELAGDLVTRHEPFKVYRALGDFLAREGFAVLRWDKRPKLDYDDYARDGRDAIAFLASRPEVDANAVVVVGHSEGGFIAADVAHDNPHVSAVVLLAPFIGVFEGGATQTEEYGRIRLAQLDLFTYVRMHRTAAERRKCIDVARGHGDPHGICLAPLENDQVAAAIAYTEHTTERLAALRVPVFALQGSVDRNVSPDTIPRLREILRGPDHDVELHYVPNVSHLLVDAVRGDAKPAIADEVKRRLHAFLATIRR